MTNWIEIGRMDELGRMDTPVHRLDARAKAIVTLAFVGVVMSFPRYEIAALMPFFLYPLAILSRGRIPLRYIARKILVAAPFAILIGIFNPLLDRTPAVVLGPLVVTGGWLSFVSIMLRFVLTVGAALTLVSCTGMYRLGAALEQLGLPRVFVVQILFLYRYLFVVAQEGVKMVRSVELRTPGGRAMRLGVYGSLLGHLLLRSMDRAERVHRAMLARGFDGRIRVLNRSPWRISDWAFTAGWMAYFVAARAFNLAALLGEWITGSLS